MPGRHASRVLFVAVLTLLAGERPWAAEKAGPPPLIPRQLLFGNPERARPTISPDGTRLAWLAPDRKDVLQLWVKSMREKSARQVTDSRRYGVRDYFWAENDHTLLYLQDSDGDANTHVYGLDLDGGNVRDYTPFVGVRAEQVWVTPRIPDAILVSMNLRDRRVFDVYSIDLRTGGIAADTDNPGDVVRFLATDDLEVLIAEAVTPDGGTEIRYRRSTSSPFTLLSKAPFGEELSSLDFSADGRRLYLKSSVGSSTVRVVVKDLLTGVDHVAAENPGLDAGAVIIEPHKHVLEAVDFPAARQSWTVVDPAVKSDFDGIRKVSGGDFSVLSRDRADRMWIVGFTEDRGSQRFFTWDRSARKGALLFAQEPRLDKLPLAEMKPVTFEARDKLLLQGYLTLPPGVPPKKLPLVLLVHGGPWARDVWGYDADVQWLANRGYAVLQVNFRGSTGYGKAFLNAGNKQWGKGMEEDLVDAVRWAVNEGYADSSKVAILGGSYGGYSALAGVTFSPDVFRCAVDLFGPSNLLTLLANLPPYKKPLLAAFRQRIGDPEKDKKLLQDASPMFRAADIKAPLLIGQGANDPVVKPLESAQMVAAIEQSGGAVTYVLYPDEGHGFARPENRVDFNARAEAFLSDCLGGRLEPLQGDRIPGSTAQVKVVKAEVAKP